MLCRQCESLLSRLGRSVGLSPLAPGQATGRLGVLVCARCGSVLPASNADEHMLRRLRQFSRFGIGAESAPLLASTDGEQ